MSQENEFSKLTLYYFDGVGRGDTIRFILYYSKVNFIDNRVPFPKWLIFKKSTPQGKLPWLKIVYKDGSEGSVIQSGSIVRFLANRYGLGGKNEVESAIADEVYECTQEYLAVATEALFEADEKKRTAALQEVRERVSIIFGHLEKRLQENGGKYIAGGDGFTYADFAVAAIFDLMRADEEFQRHLAQIESSCPGLKALDKTVHEQEGIKEYVARRPVDKILSFRKRLRALVACFGSLRRCCCCCCYRCHRRNKVG